MEASADGSVKSPGPVRTIAPLAPRLPVLSFDDVDHDNALARYRGDFLIPGQHGDIRLRICHPGAVETANIGFARINAEINGEAVRIFIPARALTALAYTARIDVNFAEVPVEGRALLVEHVLDDVLTQLEGRGHAISIGAIHNPERGAGGPLGFVVQIGQLPPFSGFIEASEAFCQRLVIAGNRLPVPRTGFADVPVVVQLLAGVTGLDLAAYSSLSAGDTVLFDHSWLGQRRVAVLAGSNVLMAAAVSTTGFTLDSNKPVQDLRERLKWLSDDPISAGAFMDNRETSQLDPLEVKLVFELGRSTMTLAELNRLDAGHVFELNRMPDQAVDIFVMNRQIGSGELVMVGDRIGVRITRTTR